MKTTKKDISKIFSKIQKNRKRCSKCEEYKDIEDGFYLKRDGKPSSGECKVCCGGRVKKYKQRHEIKKRDKKVRAKYYKKNKKHCLNKVRQWEQTHVEYTRLKTKIIYYKNKIYIHLGKKIEFPRKYEKHDDSVKSMKKRLENLKSIWHEFKVLAK